MSDPLGHVNRRHGLTGSGRWLRRRDTFERFMRHLAAGLKVPEIAAREGCGRSTAYAVLQQRPQDFVGGEP